MLKYLDCFAVEYYVAPWGNDNNSGDQNHPFASIKFAESILIAGDVLNILTGIYYESIMIRCCGNDSMPIIFRAPQDQDVTVKAQKDFCFLISDSSDYIVIEGFKLTRAYYNLTAHGAAVRVFGNYCTIRNNQCYDNDIGIFVEDSDFDTTTTNHHNLIQGNIISDCGEAGIRIKRTDFARIVSNLLYHNGYRIEPAGAVTFYGANGTEILNNTFWDNNGPAIDNYDGSIPEETPTSTNSLIANNIATRDDGGFLLKIDSKMIEVTSNIYCYNLWFNSDLGSKVVHWGFDCFGEGGENLTFQEFLSAAGTVNSENGLGSMETNPFFVDTDNLIFDLQSGSPALNAGTLDLAELGLLGLTSQWDQSPDSGIPDMGYHHQPNVLLTNPQVCYTPVLNIYPNPANQIVCFDIQLPASNSSVIPTFYITNILGMEVDRIKPGYDDPENHFFLEWRPHYNLTSGIYFVIVKTPGARICKKLALIR